MGALGVNSTAACGREEFETIQRQYDQVIAPHYDSDPQAVLARSLDLAREQIAAAAVFDSSVLTTPDVLDVGLGTGKFLESLKERFDPTLRPYGLDVSERMIAIARRRLPDLVAEVDTAARLRRHFVGRRFRLISTHFVTGFVPIADLAPQIHEKLEPGGYWSLVGGVQQAFPELRRKSQAAAASWLPRARRIDVESIVCNPRDHDEVRRTLTEHGFVVRAEREFLPEVRFANFDEFMEFAYRGGWLTPFVETAGLHEAGWLLRTLLNVAFFPVRDHHRVSVVLAQKGPV